MTNMLQQWLSPTRVIALTALFFAIGGSAFAVAEKVTPQARCQPGAVRGLAIVTGDPTKGIANLPTEYTSASNLFLYRFNCTGKRIEVRRAGGGFDVRFVGSGARTAFVTPLAQEPATASVSGQPDGSVRVFLAGPQPGGALTLRQDIPFVVAVL